MALRTLVFALARRLRRGRAAPISPATPEPAPALMTQDLLEHSTRVAQCLYNCNTLTAGQIVTIEGYRRMVITVNDNRVTLTPLTPQAPARGTPPTEDAAQAGNDITS